MTQAEFLPKTTLRQRSVQVIAMSIGGKEPINLRQFPLLIALGVVLALIWVLIDPALALVLGIGAVGTWLVVGMRFKPRWIKALWAWYIDFGQDPHSVRNEIYTSDRKPQDLRESNQ